MENIKKRPHILIFSKISKNISAKPAQAGAEYKKNIKYGQYSAPEVTKEQSLC